MVEDINSLKKNLDEFKSELKQQKNEFEEFNSKLKLNE